MLGKHGNDTEQTFAFCGSISDRCRGLFLRGYICVDTKEKDISDRIKAYQNIVESGVFQ